LRQFANLSNATVHRDLLSSELLSDEAVYRRTRRGQRALLGADELSDEPMLRMLARVNGYTNLRGLVEMAPGEAGAIARAIRQLFADDLIELVRSSEDQALQRNAF
jgi:hypothetical protein